MIRPERRRASLAAPIVFALSLACRGPSAPDWSAEPLTDSGATLVASGERERAGDWAEAHRILTEGLLRHPGDFDLAARLQDVELRLLERGEVPEDFPPGEGTANERARRAYRARAERVGDARSLLLAARVEDDLLAALYLVQMAAGKDDADAAVHYGHAHVLFALGRLGEARQALGRVFATRPGFLRARRLEARVLAAQGEEREALVALDAWLERSGRDPRLSPAQRADAQLEAAGLELGLDQAGAALERLESLGPYEGKRGARLELLRAAALEGRRDLEGALLAARRAAQLDPSDPLPLLYEALLHGRRRGEPIAARRAWVALLERLSAQEGEFDPAAVLVALRARVELAQLERGRRTTAAERP
ncbi:MAG: hypothetical protein GC161_03210 [Planctomycetaceae bacterium]|nr:hypothetical protein [Planctomycetaceae bacterium]